MNYAMFTRRGTFLFAFAMVILMGAGDVLGQLPFSRSLEVPHIYNRRNDTLFVDVETHDFGYPGLDSVQTLAYNHSLSSSNSYLGPTLTWEVGATQTTYMLNRLPPQSGMRTTVHWHGANIPAYTDGGPHQWFDPGQPFEPSFTVLDAPATLWYHPHAEDLTYTQVQGGLAGIIIIKDPLDPVEPIIPHTYDHDDIPLIIQDIHFTSGGEVDTTRGPAGAPDRWMVTNGLIQPYRDISPQPIQFRILNGSTRNGYSLSFVTDTNNIAGSKIPFYLLASDGGYLPDSVRLVYSLETGPGIRNSVLVDFTSYANQDIYLVNSPGDLDASVVGSSVNKPPLKNNLLQIRVGATPTAPIGSIPTSLPSIFVPATADTSRNVYLTKIGGHFGIDSNQYDYGLINTVVRLNTTEDWVVHNKTNVAHPFHIHLVQFFVTGITDTLGNALPMRDNLLGPKDNILIHENEVITCRITFDSYAQPKPFNLDSSAYMYHCHILTHEDGYYGGSPGTIAGRSPYGMMQQFAVWNGEVISDVPEPVGDEIVLFPNPAGDQININANTSRVSTMKIFDLQGKLLQTNVLPPFNGVETIDVGTLSAGMILVEWSDGARREVKKMILE